MVSMFRLSVPRRSENYSGVRTYNFGARLTDVVATGKVNYTPQTMTMDQSCLRKVRPPVGVVT